jgi:hypothetical protein
MTETKNTPAPLFTKDNYKWMLIGGVIIALGFFLMSGGKSNDPNVFDYNAHYHRTNPYRNRIGGRDLCDLQKRKINPLPFSVFLCLQWH